MSRKTAIISPMMDRSYDSLQVSPLKTKMQEKSALIKGPQKRQTTHDEPLFTPDPHDHFKDQAYTYPIKDEEQSFVNQFYSEKMLGFAILPSAKCSSLCSMVCFFYFVIFGLVFFVLAQNVKEFSIRYDDTCSNKTICIINFSLSGSFQAPIYLYYELDGFQTNHKFYVDSIQPQQMLGNDLTLEDQQSYCVDAQFNSDMPHGDRSTLNSGSGYVLDYTESANPCGVAAKYIFNDTFIMSIQSKNQSVYLNQSQITFDIDSQFKFQKNDRFAFSQWLDVQNSLVMNWLTVQTLPQMKKLWARIDQNLFSGDFQMIIYNHYPTSIYQGTKTFVLSTSSQFGSKNVVLGQTLLIISAFYLFSFFFIYLKDARKQSTKKSQVQPEDDDVSAIKSHYDKSSSNLFQQDELKPKKD